MGAGQYGTRLRWWRCVRTQDGYGQLVERFEANGYLWAAVDAEGPRRRQDYGGQQTGSDADIRIRQYPAVSALDRLEADGDIWIIEAIARGTNELVCRCSRFDALGDWRADHAYEGGGSMGVR